MREGVRSFVPLSVAAVAVEMLNIIVIMLSYSLAALLVLGLRRALPERETYTHTLRRARSEQWQP
jgi:hypothetical protein